VTRGRYELASVVNHHGSTISGGHYTAFCRQRLGWFCFNDTLGARSAQRRPRPRRAVFYSGRSFIRDVGGRGGKSSVSRLLQLPPLFHLTHVTSRRHPLGTCCSTSSAPLTWCGACVALQL
jgi:hypothetical protein